LAEISGIIERFKDSGQVLRAESDFAGEPILEANEEGQSCHGFHFDNVPVHGCFPLDERCNRFGRLFRLAELPVLQEFLLVEFRPIQHKIQRAPRQFSFQNLETANIYCCLKLSILSVKVGRMMIVKEHSDDDSILMMIP
jgi:hypothetical protein